MHIETCWTDFLQGSTRIDLLHDGRSLSHIDGIIPFTLHFGIAQVRADGIAGVGTEEDCRRRGYARQVMDAALNHMEKGDAALSFLHGIGDFYHRFGYVSAGPAYEVSVGTAINANFPGPLGYTARPGVEEDLPAIQALYQANFQNVIAAAVRPQDGFVWRKLLSSLPAGECRVVTDQCGSVVGYAWLAKDCWAVRAFASGRGAHAFVIGEAMAADLQSASAVIAACRGWAEEEGRRRGVPIYQVILPLPPVGPVAAALRVQHSIAQQRYKPNGGFMARILSIERLIQSFAPELSRRVQNSGLAFSGTLALHTDIGNALLILSEDTAPQEPTFVIDLPPTTLTRLVFGTMSAGDILDQDGITVPDPVYPLLAVLFPPAYAYLALPDQC